MWWGQFEIESGKTARWRIGPLDLRVARASEEWVVSWSSGGDPKDTTVEVNAPGDTEEDPARTVNRFAMRQTGDRIGLKPRTADRPVVIKPETPVFVPTGQSVTLYVGSPVWVVIAADGTELLEIPAHRPTDTWAGPNTREGSLCYGGRTLARRRWEDCTVRPHRAITIVEVRNHATDALLIEQLQLPAPMLGLFAGSGGALFTESVVLERDDDGSLARLKIGDAVAPDGSELQRVAEPRETVRGNVVFQTFSRLFGKGE